MMSIQGVLLRMTFLLAGTVLMTSGCSGTRITVKPDPATLETTFRAKCGTVAVQKNKTGLVVREFVNELIDSKVFDKVYYPPKAGAPVDLVLNPIFEVEYDRNPVGASTKAVATGLCIMLPAPVTWYNIDYHLSGQLEVYEAGSKVDTLTAKTRSRMSMKLFSMEEEKALQPKALSKGKESLYKQLLIELDKYCMKRR